MDDSGHARLGRPPSRVAGQRDRAGGRAVVAAVRREHLVATRVKAGHPDRVLDGFGAAVGEEDLLQARWRDFGDQTRRLAAGVVGERRLNGAETARLLCDGRDELGVLVTDVHVHELRREIEVTLARVVAEVGALRRRDGKRVDQILGRPRMEHVSPIVPADDLFVVRSEAGD